MAIVVVTPPAAEPVTVAEVIVDARIDATNQEPAPGKITISLGSGAGNVDNGVHRYLATFVTADGETQAGIISTAVTITDKTINGKVELTSIPVGGGLVTARKIYRTAANGSSYLLLATIANNSAATYTDNIADASLGAEAPSTNTTGDGRINMLIESARRDAENHLRRYLITQTLDAYFDSFPCYDNNWKSVIKLPPLQSVTSITYIDGDGAEQTLASDQYQIDAISDTVRIAPAYGCSWPSTRKQNNAVKVRFIAGYGDASDVPAGIKSWILLKVKQRYDQADPVPYVDGLLDPYRVRVYA